MQYLAENGTLVGPVGLPGETLTTLPWFWSYILARTRRLLDAWRACASAGVEVPDVRDVDLFDLRAVRDYIGGAAQENTAYEAERAAMLERQRGAR